MLSESNNALHAQTIAYQAKPLKLLITLETTVGSIDMRLGNPDEVALQRSCGCHSDAQSAL